MFSHRSIDLKMFRTSTLRATRLIGNIAKNAISRQNTRSLAALAFNSAHRGNNNTQIGRQNAFCRKQQLKFYSDAPPLTREIIKGRIIDLLETYGKTKKNIEITEKSSLSKDLGLDSFDVVEVIMEIEYEFSIIIPDDDADDIKTVGQAIDYIAKQPDAF